MINLRRHLRFTVLLALLLAACLLPAAGGAASAGSITTLFNYNNWASGNMFDVEVLWPKDVEILSFDLNLGPGNPPVSVYYREGGYTGYESDASAWTLAGSTLVTSQGYNNPTHIPIGGIRLTAGKTYGFYLAVTSHDITSADMLYTNNYHPQVYEDSYLKFTSGVGKTFPSFTGTTIPNRTWNGTIYYREYVPPDPVPPQTGDAAGRGLWLYVPLGVLSCCGFLLLGKRFVRRAAH